MKDRANSLYQKILQQAGQIGQASVFGQQLPGEYTKLKSEAEALKRDAETYLKAQITLQFIATAAMVGMLYFTYKASKKRSS